MSNKGYKNYIEFIRSGGENYWQEKWEKEEAHKTGERQGKEKKYVLDMYPYPSGEGLHVGHVESYTATDIYSRFLRMRGFNVFHPQGWDAFGLPAENYAIKTGINPAKTTRNAINTFKKQINALGFSYDWEREVNTSDPEYYRWTQWFFLFLYKHGLAYRRKAKVNWCKNCQTVLANEQAEGGQCERCGSGVIQKDLEQWFFKITDFIEDQKFRGTILLIHGIRGHDKENWFPWFKKEMVGRGYKVLIPNMPDADMPVLKDWINVLRKLKDEFRGPLTIIGHSLGCPTACYFVDKEELEVDNLILVAPASKHSKTDDELIKLGFTAEQLKLMDKFKKAKVSFKNINNYAQNIIQIYSENDPYISLDAQEDYKELQGDIKIFKDKGHFNEKAGVLEFPEIIEMIKKGNKEKKVIKGLLNGLDDLDWPQSTKQGQRNWIGRSEGINFKHKVKDLDIEFEVYDSIPQTFLAQTFVVIAPEHPMVNNFVVGTKYEKEVLEFVEKIKKKKMTNKFDIEKEMDGIFTGRYVENYLGTGVDIPIWVASYALYEYGTGIVACSAHDERDWEFAKKYNIRLKPVLFPKDKELARKVKNLEIFYREPDGLLEEPVEFKGMRWDQLREPIIEYIEKKGLGRRVVYYKIRDWLVSRQRYWGAPIPIIYCDVCGEVPVPEEDLPVKLPTDVDFKPTGESPLKFSESFHKIKCPQCGKRARRESDTMDTFVCSSWYYFRYTDPKNNKEFASREMIKKWLPVDIYVGGAEHTVLHLLYSRFFTKVLEKYGYIDFNEPFTKLRHQGIILAQDGNKMSKSKGNVINPDAVVDEYGADALRMYEMFMGPLEDTKPWNTKGIIGIQRFLEKIWKQKSKIKNPSNSAGRQKSKLEIKMQKLLHKTIEKVTEDIEELKFNTAISQMMILINSIEREDGITKNIFEKFLIILSPFAPHIAEELWSEIGHKESIFKQNWPEYDKELVKDEMINLVLQVNGKVRDSIEVVADISEAEAEKIAQESEKIKKWIEGKEVVKVIFVKGKLVNVVVR